MSERIVEHYAHAPSALNFMRRTIGRRFRQLAEDGSLPRIALRWTGLQIGSSELQAFQQATGLGEKTAEPVLYPHVFGFRLQMALLTHRAYPLPIWTALQIRNRLVLHHLFDPREPMELETRIGDHRFVDKGVEVDLESRLMRGKDCYWESRITYFYRGRFGARPAAETKTPAPVLAAPANVERFRIPDGGGWGFGKLTGDYNGIHNWPWYARRFGFPTAFLHPQRVAGMCLARLEGPPGDAQTLELWIKGPVFYGANALLHAAQGDDGLRFGLSLEGDQRMALVGQWRAGVPAPKGQESAQGVC